MRFIVDGMLGKLSRWLRMLGHDVMYYRSADDKMLMDLAKAGSRVLLTRDQKLYQQSLSNGLQAAFVDEKDESKRLAFLAKRFGFKLEIDMAVSLCPKCNGSLAKVSKDSVKKQVPEGTFTYYDDFWKCKSCGKVYWQGAHWKRILSALEDANSKLCVV